jgi:HD-like signal output (HDOD) protein
MLTQSDFLLLLASRLQPLPETVTRLAALDPTDCEIADVAEAVRLDTAFVSRLLRTANSAFSASATRVSNLDEAIMRMGIGLLVSMSHALVARRP